MNTKNVKGGRKRTRAVASSSRRSPAGLWILAGLTVAIVGLAALYLSNRPEGSASASTYSYQVGDPGPGAAAPEIKLDSTAGGTFDLASMKGKTVLLYFQEGLSCQPCWDQLKDVEGSFERFKTLGIDQIVTITTDPIDQIQQKVADEGITTPVLSDPGLVASSAYHANSYGMMGDSRDGHTFIVVGPDGAIRWRADYGGAPDFTMFLPVDALLADIQKGLGSGS